MRIKTWCTAVLCLLIACATRKSSPTVSETKVDSAQVNDIFLTNLLQQHPSFFDSLLKQNQRWQIRIIYTQIDRKADNSPVFTDHFFNIDPQQYFYPASTVKMPVAVLALQKLHELRIKGLDRNSTMITEAAYSGQSPVYNDPNSEDGRPTIANYIKKIFLVSDNGAFNRLYEFLGQEYINSHLHKMGYDSAQILHRLDIVLTEDQNRHTNPIKFYDSSSRLLHTQAAANSEMRYQPRQTFLGNGYMSGGLLVNKPLDFSKKNRLLLTDLHSILKSIIFPSAVPAKKRFNLATADYDFLYRYMSMKPGESVYPHYDSTYDDAYSKFLLYGGRGEMAPGVRIFNKEGDAYGFLTDVAYVVDFDKKIEFLLSASIYCNSDGILNDDKYDYENVGLPFLKNLGQVIYEYELQRPRKNIPDLVKFQINYDR
jgi:hypothetical protein